jgi:hypothetical protein
MTPPTVSLRGAHREDTTVVGTLVRLALILVLLQVAFFALLVVGQLVPDRPIVQNLARAVETGTYGPSSLPDRMGGIGDSFTECVVVGTGLGASSGESAVHRAAVMPRISNCTRGAGEITALSQGRTVESDPYFKYWAGYTAIVRPVVALTGIEGMRLVSGAALVGGLLCAFVPLARTTSTLTAVLLLGPLLLTSNIMSTPSTAFSHALSMSVALVGMGACARLAVRGVAPAATVAMMAGAVYCYVDLLTNTPLAWMLTVAAATLASAWARHPVRQVATTAVATMVLWMAGFALTWVSRWVIAMIWVGPSEAMSVIRENVAFRTGGANPNVQTGLGRAVGSNIGYWWAHVPTTPVVVTLFALAGIGAALWWVRQGRPAAAAKLSLLLAAPVLAPLAWFTIMNNHSQIHSFLTYRAVPGALGVLGAAVATGLAVTMASESSPVPVRGPLS